MKNTKYLIVPSLLLVLCACSNSKLNIEFSETNEFNSGDNLSACTLVKSINGTEITDEMISSNNITVKDIELTCEKLDTSTPGEHTAVFKYGEDEYFFNYIVKDVHAPMIVANDEIDIDLNSEFKLDDHIVFSDNGTVSYTVTGQVDTSTNGKYQIKVSCKDNAGNYSEKNIWVNVGSGGEEHPLGHSNTLARDPNADKLIAEMNQQGKPIVNEPEFIIEHEEVSNEELIENVEVLDPYCVAGVYEIEAETGLEAANKAMEEYDCWQVEAKPITNDNSEDPENSGKRFSVSCICSKNSSIKKSGNYEPAKATPQEGTN